MALTLHASGDLPALAGAGGAGAIASMPAPHV